MKNQTFAYVVPNNMISWDSEHAYKKYYEAVSNMLKIMPSSIQNILMQLGGEIVGMEWGAGTQLLVIPLGSSHDYVLSEATVFCSEYVDAGRSMAEINSYLPDAFAMSIACTAGMVEHTVDGKLKRGKYRYV